MFNFNNKTTKVYFILNISYIYPIDKVFTIIYFSSVQISC
uniref:Uncharacterized protein n=1 Tax=uncultured Desulfobacterium sp. TaxID=201089 RepID=E1YEU3_9BACT|nr:unknown protein [uncultured Desulfobacterium sp.]